ncbi:MAG: hypothetical protein IT301_11840 [Dehalococcoidia bacterium]|nr:hypothetical protein [Dehalococcoidia bacterium]
MSTKERLHQLIDEMNEDQAAVLLMDLEWEPSPLSAEDREAIARGLADSEAGRTRPHAEVMKRFGLSG